MKMLKKLFIIGCLFSLLQGCDKEAANNVLQEFKENAPVVMEEAKELFSKLKEAKEYIELFKETSNNTIENLPEYSGVPYSVLTGNVPAFTENDLTTESYEFYSELDHLDRPGMAIACLGPETMATEERGSIGQIKPAGWHTVKYDCITDGMYLYNRCHLIGYQLCGTNFLADETDDTKAKNLITGTRYLNVEGMLPFENMVAEYIENSGNHVLYRVTPIYTGNNLIADGVQMEAYSVEDNGEGICFNVFCYNVQPDIEINYATGESWEE